MLCIGGQLSPVVPVKHPIHAGQRHRFAQRLLDQWLEARDDDHPTLVGVLHDLVQRRALLLQRGFGAIAKCALWPRGLARAGRYGAVRGAHSTGSTNRPANGLGCLFQRQPKLQRQQHRLRYTQFIGACGLLQAQPCRLDLLDTACRSGHNGLQVGRPYY